MLQTNEGYISGKDVGCGFIYGVIKELLFTLPRTPGNVKEDFSSAVADPSRSGGDSLHPTSGLPLSQAMQDHQHGADPLHEMPQAQILIGGVLIVIVIGQR
jgi:hypothetical protein